MSLICGNCYVLPVRLSTVCNCQLRYASNYDFIPACLPAKTNDLLRLKNFIENNNNICVLTGAGVSTESGIPDYRSKGVGLYARSTRRPVLYQDFCKNESVRRRYWARNYIGWPRFSSFQPNITHRILKELEENGKISCVITQNVDGLHTKAGSKKIIELHGTAFRVVCLKCNYKTERHDFQTTLNELNPSLKVTSKIIRPDGDVDLSEKETENFNIPYCPKCKGILKPDIVFFGDNVSRNVIENVKQNVEQSSCLLVLGTSLSTFSGYRIVLQALEAKKLIALVNIGESRADDRVLIKIEAKCGDVLSMVCHTNVSTKVHKML